MRIPRGAFAFARCRPALTLTLAPRAPAAHPFAPFTKRVARAFSASAVARKGLAPRQLPVLNAFCTYLEGRDLSGFTHRAAVYHDFLENASPEIQALAVYVRSPSDLLYLYKDQLSEKFPEFWNMRRTPVTRPQPKRKNVARPRLKVDIDILHAYTKFLRKFDWRRPVTRAVLRDEFTRSLPPGPMPTRIKGTVSFWKNFELSHNADLSASIPQYAHLYNLRALHVVNEEGIVRKLSVAEQAELGGFLGVARREGVPAHFFEQRAGEAEAVEPGKARVRRRTAAEIEADAKAAEEPAGVRRRPGRPRKKVEGE